jgi:hypothetical protein
MLSPLAHLLWFFLVCTLLMAFVVIHSLLVNGLPYEMNETFSRSFGALMYHAFWIAFPLSIPISLFMTLFYIRKGKVHRFLAGLLVLISSSLLFTFLFVTMERLLPYEELPEPPGPESFWIEGYFHHLDSQYVYPLGGEEDSSAVLLSEPLSASGSRFQIKPLHSFSIPEDYNVHIEPWVPKPFLFAFLTKDVFALRKNLLSSAVLGLLPLLAFIAAQGWFCVQVWVIVRTGRWPFFNLLLGVGAFILFMKTHFFIQSELYTLLPEWLPEPLPFLLLSLPFFFWNVFSRGGAAGDE